MLLKNNKQISILLKLKKIENETKTKNLTIAINMLL